VDLGGISPSGRSPLSYTQRTTTRKIDKDNPLYRQKSSFKPSFHKEQLRREMDEAIFLARETSVKKRKEFEFAESLRRSITPSKTRKLNEGQVPLSSTHKTFKNPLR